MEITDVDKITTEQLCRMSAKELKEYDKLKWLKREEERLEKIKQNRLTIEEHIALGKFLKELEHKFGNLRISYKPKSSKIVNRCIKISDKIGQLKSDLEEFLYVEESYKEGFKKMNYETNDIFSIYF